MKKKSEKKIKQKPSKSAVKRMIEDAAERKVKKENKGKK